MMEIMKFVYDQEKSIIHLFALFGIMCFSLCGFPGIVLLAQ